MTGLDSIAGHDQFGHDSQTDWVAPASYFDGHDQQVFCPQNFTICDVRLRLGSINFDSFWLTEDSHDRLKQTGRFTWLANPVMTFEHTLLSKGLEEATN